MKVKPMLGLYKIFTLFILIIESNSSFLVFPLKSKKINNNDLNLNDSKLKKYLEPNLTPELFLKHWLSQTIFTEIAMGNPAQKLIAEFYTNTSCTLCVYDQRFQQEKNFNMFTDTITDYSEITVRESNNDITIFGFTTDKVQFQSTNSLASTNLNPVNANMELWFNNLRFFKDQFPNIDSNIKNLNMTFTMQFGIQPDSYGTYVARSNFIKGLKNNNLINSYELTFDFYKSTNVNYNEEADEVGRIIFAKFEQTHDSEQFPIENLRTTKMLIDNSYITRYRILMNNAYIQTKDSSTSIESNTEIEFFYDQGLIIGVKSYENLMEEEFFNVYPNMCVKEQAYDLYRGKKSLFEMFICDKNIIDKYKNKFPNLKFYSQDLKYTFEMNYNDLFKEYQGKSYFLIVFPKNKEENSKLWEVGRLFLKKYPMFFNLDGKVVRYYPVPEEKKEEEKVVKEKTSGVKIFFIVVSVLVVFVAFICLAYYLGKRLNKRRKIRANELEDNYDYFEDKKSGMNLVNLN